MRKVHIPWLRHCFTSYCFTSILAACTNPNAPETPAVPDGYVLVDSMHGVYRYALPKEWVKATSNSYVSPDEAHRILEQIYPKAKITLEYCQSFVVMGDAQPGDRSARLYDNGAFNGCFRTHDYHNSKLGTTWRHASFSFPGPHGVEDLTIVTRLDQYDEAEVIRIFDSIRAKRPRSAARRR